MRIDDIEEGTVDDAQDQASGSPSFPGSGTLENPFLPAAFDDNFRYIADLAQQRGEPQYCEFEISRFRISPDGKVEWGHNMPPLRDNIASIIETALQQWREQLQQS